MDRLAVTNLTRQGFRIFCPLIMKTVRHARQFRTALRPLFPGYVFVALDLGRDRWRSINGTYGVTGIVMGGNQPARVPKGIVEALMVMSADGEYVRFEQSLSAGEKVRILAGPFADLIGILEKIDDAGRVRVLLQMMGSHISVTTTSDMLIPAA